MIEILGAAAAFGLSSGLSPGPLLALVAAETLARGRKAGIAVAAAPLLTDGPIIAVALVLLDRIEDSQPAIGIVSIAGGLLLASWGIAGLRRPTAEIDEAVAAQRVWGSLGKGVAANLLNPGPYLFWLTIGAPLLLRADALGRPAAAAFLGLFYFGLVGSKAVLAILIGRSREILRGRGYVWVNRLLAMVMLVYAVLFVHEGLSKLLGH